MSTEKNALAHIDFLIDEDIRETLGITGRDLDAQVLRLCGGYNEAMAFLEAKQLTLDIFKTEQGLLKDKVISLKADLELTIHQLDLQVEHSKELDDSWKSAQAENRRLRKLLDMEKYRDDKSQELHGMPYTALNNDDQWFVRQAIKGEDDG